MLFRRINQCIPPAGVINQIGELQRNEAEAALMSLDQDDLDDQVVATFEASMKWWGVCENTEDPYEPMSYLGKVAAVEGAVAQESGVTRDSTTLNRIVLGTAWLSQHQIFGNLPTDACNRALLELAAIPRDLVGAQQNLIADNARVPLDILFMANEFAEAA